MLPCPANDTCLAYLVRHGATDNNLADPPLLQGRVLDGDLSGAGRLQAQRASDALRHHGVQAVFSSPLKRARQTAEVIAQPQSLPVTAIGEITEADVGAWEGRSWAEIQQNESERYRQFIQDPAAHGYRDGENLQQVCDRVVPAINGLMSDHLGKRIVIVAHNVVNRVYLASTIQLPVSRARSLSQDNCGINLLRFREGSVKVVSVNHVFHLWKRDDG